MAFYSLRCHVSSTRRRPSPLSRRDAMCRSEWRPASACGKWCRASVLRSSARRQCPPSGGTCCGGAQRQPRALGLRRGRTPVEKRHLRRELPMTASIGFSQPGGSNRLHAGDQHRGSGNPDRRGRWPVVAFYSLRCHVSSTRRRPSPLGWLDAEREPRSTTFWSRVLQN